MERARAVEGIKARAMFEGRRADEDGGVAGGRAVVKAGSREGTK